MTAHLQELLGRQADIPATESRLQTLGCHEYENLVQDELRAKSYFLARIDQGMDHDCVEAAMLRCQWDRAARALRGFRFR